MQYNEACIIFGVDNSNKLTEFEIKKIYRRLVKEHHPDNNGSDDTFTKLNEALEVMNKGVNGSRNKDTSKTSSNNIMLIINKVQLFMLLENASIYFQNGDGHTVELSMNTIDNYNCKLGMNYTIAINSRIENRVTEFIVKSNGGRLNIEIPVEELGNNDEIILNILNQRVHTTMKLQLHEISLNITKYFELKIKMRKVVHDEKRRYNNGNNRV